MPNQFDAKAARQGFVFAPVGQQPKPLYRIYLRNPDGLKRVDPPKHGSLYHAFDAVTTLLMIKNLRVAPAGESPEQRKRRDAERNKLMRAYNLEHGIAETHVFRGFGLDDELKDTVNDIDRDVLQQIIDAGRDGQISQKIAEGLAAYIDAVKQRDKPENLQMSEQLVRASALAEESSVVLNNNIQNLLNLKTQARDNGVDGAIVDQETQRDRLAEARQKDAQMAQTINRQSQQYLFVHEARESATRKAAEIATKRIADVAAARNTASAGQLQAEKRGFQHVAAQQMLITVQAKNAIDAAATVDTTNGVIDAAKNSFDVNLAPEVKSIFDANIARIEVFAPDRTIAVRLLTDFTALLGYRVGAEQQRAVLEKEVLISARVKEAVAKIGKAQKNEDTPENIIEMRAAGIAAAQQAAISLGDVRLADNIIAEIKAAPRIGAPTRQTLFQGISAIGTEKQNKLDAVNQAEQAAIKRYVALHARMAAVVAGGNVAGDATTAARVAKTAYDTALAVATEFGDPSYADDVNQVIATLNLRTADNTIVTTAFKNHSNESDAKMRAALPLADNLTVAGVVVAPNYRVAVAEYKENEKYSSTVIKDMTDAFSQKAEKIAQSVNAPALMSMIRDNMNLIVSHANQVDAINIMRHATQRAVDAARTTKAEQDRLGSRDDLRNKRDIKRQANQAMRTAATELGLNVHVVDALVDEIDALGSATSADLLNDIATIATREALNNIILNANRMLDDFRRLLSGKVGAQQKREIAEKRMFLVERVLAAVRETKEAQDRVGAGADNSAANIEAIKNSALAAAREAAKAVDDPELTTFANNFIYHVQHTPILPPRQNTFNGLLNVIGANEMYIAQRAFEAARRTHAEQEARGVADDVAIGAITDSAVTAANAAATELGNPGYAATIVNIIMAERTIASTKDELLKGIGSRCDASVNYRPLQNINTAEKATMQRYIAMFAQHAAARQAAEFVAAGYNTADSAGVIARVACKAAEDAAKAIGVEDYAQEIVTTIQTNKTNNVAVIEAIQRHIDGVTAERDMNLAAIPADIGRNFYFSPGKLGSVTPYHENMQNLRIKVAEEKVARLNREIDALTAAQSAATANAGAGGYVAATAATKAATESLQSDLSAATQELEALKKEFGPTALVRKKNSELGRDKRGSLSKARYEFFAAQEAWQKGEKLREARLQEAKALDQKEAETLDPVNPKPKLKDAKMLPANFDKSATHFTKNSADGKLVSFRYNPQLDAPHPAFNLLPPAMIERRQWRDADGKTHIRYDLVGTDINKDGKPLSTQEQKQFQDELVKFMNDKKLKISGNPLIFTAQHKQVDGGVVFDHTMKVKYGLHGYERFINTDELKDPENAAKIFNAYEEFLKSKGYQVHKEVPNPNAAVKGTVIIQPDRKEVHIAQDVTGATPPLGKRPPSI